MLGGPSLPNHDEESQTHRQLGKQVVVRCGEAKLESMPEKCIRVSHHVVLSTSVANKCVRSISQLNRAEHTNVKRFASVRHAVLKKGRERSARLQMWRVRTHNGSLRIGQSALIILK